MADGRHFQAKLEAERDMLVKGMRPNGDRCSNPDELDDMKGIVATVEVLDSKKRAKLRKIDEALERLKTGVYGQCSECGDPIAKKRLVAMPTTTQCLRCAATAETRAYS